MYTIDSEEEDLKENLESESKAEQKEEDVEEEKEIKKVGGDTNESIAFYPPPARKKGSKKVFFIAIVVIILLVAGFLLRNKIIGVVTEGPKPTPTPNATPAPTPTPNPLIRSDWSFEVLNGTTTSGQAKKLADKLTALGYPVVKTGNADKQSLPDGKQSYETTQILVKKDLMGKIDLVVADLRDTVKIASVAGELKEGTASARIIIGKDLSL